MAAEAGKVWGVLQGVAVCCSVSQEGVAVLCNMFQCVRTSDTIMMASEAGKVWGVLQRGAVCCTSVLQCVAAVCCSVVQYVAVYTNFRPGCDGVWGW